MAKKDPHINSYSSPQKQSIKKTFVSSKKKEILNPFKEFTIVEEFKNVLRDFSMETIVEVEHVLSLDTDALR